MEDDQITSILVRLPKLMRDQIDEMAQITHRSINGMMLTIIDDAISKFKADSISSMDSRNLAENK